MKKILFFTHFPISHINPILPLIRRMLEEKNEVYCFAVEQNKALLLSEGVKYIDYPKSLLTFKQSKTVKKIENIIADRLSKNNLAGILNLILKKDIISVYNHSHEEMEYISREVQNIQPDVVFRDSVDIIGKQVCKTLNIKTIGYITNNLYSQNFFNKNPKLYYSHFLRIAEWDYLLTDEEYEHLFSLSTQIYEEVAHELNTLQIPTYNHLDPNEQINLIFSTQFLQPKELEKGRSYLVVPPSLNDFRKNINEQDDPELIHFLNSDKKIIYLATGSFAKESDEYYLNMIKAFNMTDYKLVISWNKEEQALKELLSTIVFDLKNVLIRKYIPQNFVLQFTDLFITSGGLNSIIESIYFEVPLLVKPISAEQVLNGLLIEELGLGMTLYKKREEHLSTGEMILRTLSDRNIKSNLQRYSIELKAQDSNEILNKIIECI